MIKVLVDKRWDRINLVGVCHMIALGVRRSFVNVKLSAVILLEGAPLEQVGQYRYLVSSDLSCCAPSIRYIIIIITLCTLYKISRLLYFPITLLHQLNHSFTSLLHAPLHITHL